jgi:uncharacterized protein (TIGR03437 family)
VDIQVNNEWHTSNVVSNYVANTAPGVFTQTENGLGYGEIEHLGIGKFRGASGIGGDRCEPGNRRRDAGGVPDRVWATVSPTVADGAPGPSSTPSQTTNTIAVDFWGTVGRTISPGLAPTYSGLYQLNLTVPATGITVGPKLFGHLGAGFLHVVSVDSDSSYRYGRHYRQR